MMINVYELAYSWYEDYSPVLFYCNNECRGMDLTQEDWKNFCDKLLPDAVKLAIEKDSREDSYGWVGWADIVVAMAELIEKKGFTRIKPIKHDYWGSTIIEKDHDDENKLLSPESMKALVDHNAKVRDQLHRETDEIMKDK